MKINSFFKIIAFALTVVTAVSCDKDFNELGADFVGDDHYDFTSAPFEVKAHTQALGPVQSNNLPINPLGYYTNGVFGKTKASFVTQLELAVADPKFYNVTEIDSVYLHIPYFARAESVDANGDATYKPLDSVYGNLNGKIRLNVYKSNYYLRSLDPGSGLTDPQRYYSNQKSDFDSHHDAARLNDNSTKPEQNDDFQFKNDQIKFYKTDASGNLLNPLEVRERLVPGMYMDLNKSFFYNYIINAPAGKLENNNTFKDYFRGLYFEVQDHPENPNHSALSLLNFAQGRIVIVYKGNSSATDTQPKKRKVLTLNMKGNTVSLLENNYSSAYSAALGAANMATGDSQLFLKGGQGSMSIIELFDGQANASSALLNQMRSERWIINEANLVFHIDNTAAGMGGISDTDIKRQEPNRIYLYDYNNKKPLIDYYLDTSTFSDPKFNKYSHNGIVQKASSNERGTKYKVRITNHIRSLVKNIDSTNVKLGLVVTENINNIVSYKAVNPSPFTGANATFVPAASVMSQLGTVLYGNNIPVNDPNYNKRLRLEIIYTKPVQN